MNSNQLEQAAIERAKRIGTYQKIDRRAQYPASDYANPHELLKAVNALGIHIRGAQVNQGRMQRTLMNLKLRNTLVTSVVTALVIKYFPALVDLVGKLWR